MTVYAHGRVATVTTIRRVRHLPPWSLVTAMVGQPVKAMDAIAIVERPQEHRIINLAERLGVKGRQYVESYVVKREGDPIQKGDVLASRKGFLGLSRRRIVAPFDGQIVQVKEGRLVLEGEGEREEIYASVPGRVTQIEIGEHVVIETQGTLIQVAWGHGGFAWGTLKVLDSTPGLSADPGRFNIDHRGAIVAIGAPLSQEFLDAAVEIRVKGLLASSMHAGLLPLVEEMEFPVGLTQGFGHMPMCGRILSLLNTHNGRDISFDMSLSSDWRDIRPEIIIPITGQAGSSGEDKDSEHEVFKVGQKVRIRQMPYLGELGTISRLPNAPQQLESGLWVPGAFVEVPTGETVYVAFANLEQLS